MDQPTIPLPVLLSLHAEGAAFAKTRVASLRLQAGFGAIGDRHAGRDPERALLLTSAATYDDLRRRGLELRYGDLGENVVIEGVQVEALPLGTRLRCGEAVLELSRPCPVCARLVTLHPYLPKWLHHRRGVYARVLKSGVVCEGEPVVTLLNRNAPL